MFYFINDGKKITLTGENVLAVCPRCGKEHKAALSSISIEALCEDCKVDNAPAPATDKAREGRVRAMASSRGYRVCVQRGKYMLGVRKRGGKCVAFLGANPPYSATLDEIEEFLKNTPTTIKRGITFNNQEQEG
jgi:hypothetical protein